MQILNLQPDNIKKAVAYLKEGGILIHPTDTCYGIAADITNPQAVQKVIRLKKMSDQKPMSILVSDLEMLQKYGQFNSSSRKIIKEYLPGALTLVVSKNKQVPSFYAPQTNFIGIRYPQHALSLQLVELLGNPITTTSANLTGKPQAYSLETIKTYFQASDILVLDGGELPHKKPSTILKITDDFWEILRQGDLVIRLPKKN